MEVLVAVINNPDAVDDILARFVEIGVKGATVIDSVGMARLISDKVPLFAGLRELVSPEREHSKTIFSVIEDEATVQRAIDALESVVGDLCQPDRGFVFTVPVRRVKGLLIGSRDGEARKEAKSYR